MDHFWASVFFLLDTHSLTAEQFSFSCRFFILIFPFIEVTLLITMLIWCYLVKGAPMLETENRYISMKLHNLFGRTSENMYFVYADDAVFSTEETTQSVCWFFARSFLVTVKTEIISEFEEYSIYLIWQTSIRPLCL